MFSLKNLQGDSDVGPCPVWALPPLPNLSKVSCPLWPPPAAQQPHLTQGFPYNLTILSQVCPARGSQLPHPGRAISPDQHRLGEGLSATGPHWFPLATLHEPLCSAGSDSHLREVPSSPTCAYIPPPSTATGSTQLCAGLRTGRLNHSAQL